MKKLNIEKSIQVGNFVVGLVKESEALVYTTVQTESNDGGVLIANIDPLRDKMLYATCRQLFDMACDGDNVAEMLIGNYCITMYVARGCAIADNKYVDDITKAAKSMYVRVKAETDKAGEKLDIKEETSEEALAKMKEEEDIMKLSV